MPLFRWSVGIIASVVGGILLFEALGLSIFQKTGFAHGYCYLRNPKMIWLHVISDLLIGGAYVSISATLSYLVYKASKNIPFNWVFLAFGLFIVSCGFTHFMEVWVIWDPVYWASGYVKVVTAAASLATAIALFPLVPKVFALIHAVKQAEARRQEIERLNTELERFNYSVAHDLRAPLRAASGLAQVVTEDYADKLDDAGKATLGQIQKAMHRMDAMLTDLLKYTGVNSQSVALKPMELRTAVDNAINALRTDIEEKKAQIHVQETLPAVIASDTLLSLVFQNLIGNSLKFVRPGAVPHIHVRAEENGGRVIVYLQDNGIGIPANQRERVFQLFERLDPSYPGTGIGLPIVRRAVERMNGTIEVSDSGNEHGTVFRLTLPAALPTASPT